MDPIIKLAVTDYKKGSVRGYIVMSKAIKKLKKIKMEPKNFDALQASVLESPWEKVDELMHLEGEEFINELKKVIKHVRWKTN